MSPFLAWGDFHARSRFARSTIPEKKWGTTRSLVRTPHIHQSKIGLDRDVYDPGLFHNLNLNLNLNLNFCDITLLSDSILCIFATYKTTKRLGRVNFPKDLWDHHTEDTLLGSLSNNDGDDNQNGKKAIGLDWQNNNFARAPRFFVHLFAVTAPLRRENA